MPGKDIINNATLQIGTYSIRHVNTGQCVALKDTNRRSTLIALQDSHFEHLAVSFRYCTIFSYYTYNVRSFLQNTFVRMGQSPKAGAELVSGTESCPWIIRPAGFGNIYFISPYFDPSLYWTIAKTRDGTCVSIYFQCPVHTSLLYHSRQQARLTDNPKHHVYWQFSKMSA
ncbi:hypothetical protein K503DRAFT_60616 [Rhizopogon vinicolor AM-OR11-026]|uniref:Ricin B lectin domain-containing protein n=1 Tax=Rhizopogon vinicolor AM-OR11-026 TaxID=1314800 RepID=A0A1B7N4B7_9AGAM|nr:hypothetical protein K503DRAFT_60616 [Rhizopogon vinicolor AM-OR11-026]